MKFITTQSPDGTEDIFLFPRDIHHDAMAEVLARIKNQTHGQWRRVSRTPVAAGFVTNGVCYGRSETLKLAARNKDTQILGAAPGLSKVSTARREDDSLGAVS